MTVGNKLHQTLTTLEGAKANLESFALETDNTNAQNVYNKCAQDIQNVAQQLESRVNQVEQEEPQFKARQQQGQQNNQ